MKTALGTGKGIQRIVGAGLKSPLDFSMGLAKGFHNAPKLYGDEVRQVDKVTGFNSGMKTAAKEFGLGFYDGLSGLVTQPLKGARKEGAAGFLKGVGMGVGGLVLKPGAGTFGLFFPFPTVSSSALPLCFYLLRHSSLSSPSL